MAFFCLSKEVADSLKARAVAGEINIQELYDMTSEKRRSFFEKFVDAETAKGINAGFEQAIISEQQSALQNWAKAVFTGSEKTGRKKDIFDKIESLSDLGALNPANQDAFLQDLVAMRLGATITAQEASTIADKATKLEELAKDTSKFGTPTIEYFEARKDMENYLESLNPSSRLKVLTSIIGRASMLASFKSPLLNIESNTIQAFLTGAERRINSRSFSGSNNSYAGEYIKFVNQVYKKSGYDISRMRTISGEQTVRGENIVTSEGGGKIRRAGRFYEDVIFKNLMGAPDVAFSSVHFADSANLTSSKLAESMGLKGKAKKDKALAIFKDATSIDPKTPEGRKVREQAIADAEYATYTNKSNLSDLALGIRGLLNLGTGDIRLGDQLMPFVKTPANVIQAGLDYSGVTLAPSAVFRGAKTLIAISKGESVSEAVLQNFDGYAKQMVRAGLGTLLAFVLSSLFEPEEFIGEYPVSKSEQELLRLKNATTNSVKIGDKWVSLDYFGALGAPLVAMLYAKKYGTDTTSKMLNYHIGTARQVAKLPGLEIGKDVFEVLNRTKFNGAEEIKGDITKGAVDYVRSRTIPALVYDIAKMLDPLERRTDPKKPLTSVKNVIPGVRQSLPVKRTVLGTPVKAESPLSTLLFGSRVKTSQTSPLIDEITRLSETGNLPSITDYAKTSGRMKELKVQIGDEKFAEAEKYLGERLNKKMTEEINKGGYKRANDEKKASRLNTVKEKALEKTLREFKYKKKLKGSKP